jgi:hypothetical protein
VSFSPKQVKNMIDENQKHADMVNSKREERQEKTLDINEEKNEIQEQIALLKKEQELLKEKMKIEKELQLQKEKEMELEQKNKEQEILMQALREKMEKERLEREEEKKREQEQVGNKLKMLENMIAEMKGQSSLSLPQLLTQQTLMDEPDEKTSGDTKVQLDALHQDPQKHDIYPLKRTIKRQSKQLVTETDTKTLDHGEKKELVSKGKVAAKEKEKGCENDLYLDDSAEEEETNHTNDLYLDDSTEEEETDHENDLYYDSSEE